MNLPKIEKNILEYWRKNNIFKKSLEKKSPRGNFVFYEGPPTANGKPHLGHVLTRAYKDVILRYKTMQGFNVSRKAGWDAQGLPVEIEVEKELGLKGKSDIEKVGIEKFNRKCKKSVWKYKDEWEKITQRIGYWLDLKNAYITYDSNYIETIWWIIKNIWQKGLLYQDYKVVPYCPRCGTTLSSHEVAQGYKNIEETSVYLKFKIFPDKHNQNLKFDKPTYLLVWTTTPWTLPANVALAVNKNIRYVEILKDNEYWILAKSRLNIIDEKFKIINEFLGEQLLNLEYSPIFNFIKPEKRCWFVIHGDFVTDEDGTGIVHIAPAFGEDDMNAAKSNNLPVLVTVGLDGRIISEVRPWAGLWVKNANPLIIENLKEKDILIKTEKIRHDYPFCWRCGTPLLYYAKPSWFIKMSDTGIKKALIENNQKINWIPSYIKEGRFGEWLRKIKDWALSRERYWGTPLPIWECQKCHYRMCVGSFQELAQLSGKSIPKDFDPHRPFIDNYTWKCPRCGGVMKRVPEVLDCWFDSGSMPFAQNKNFVKKNKDNLVKQIPFPADFICEAVDQTRGWFYSLLAISTLLGYGTPYKNVISLGHVLDIHGKKMSKSKGNVIAPSGPIDEYGADSLRLYFYTISGPGDPKSFNMHDLKRISSKIILFYNIFEFYKLYSDGQLTKNIEITNVLDKWILIKLNLLIKEVTKKMDIYDITGSARELLNFEENLSGWYLRRSRKRFKKEQVANQIFCQILLTYTKLLAPFIPFTSEKIYLDLTKGAARKSVHLEDWPEFDEKIIDKKILSGMKRTRKICEIGHALRKNANIKVRQPLEILLVKDEKLPKGFIDLIKDELNIKKVDFVKEFPQKNVHWQIGEGFEINLALNIEITPLLKREGLTKEIIRAINSLRKEANLTKENLVDVYFKTESSELKNILQKFNKEIKTNTATKNLIEKMPTKNNAKKEISIGKEKIILAI